MTFVQSAYLLIGIPLLLWSLTSLMTVTSTREATRSMHHRGVWLHGTSQTHFALTSMVAHIGGVAVIAALLVQSAR